MKQLKTDIEGVGINDKGDFFYPYKIVMYTGSPALDVDILYFSKNGNISRINIYVRYETAIMLQLEQ